MFTWACLNFLYLENLDSIIMIFEINKNHPLFLTMDKNGLQIQWSWVLNNIKTYVCMCVLSRKSWGNKTLFFVNDLTCIKLVLSDIREISKIARVVIWWEFCENSRWSFNGFSIQNRISLRTSKWIQTSNGFFMKFFWAFDIPSKLLKKN